MAKTIDPLAHVDASLIQKIGEKVRMIDEADEPINEPPRILYGILTYPAKFHVEFADMGFKPSDRQTLMKDAAAGIPAAIKRLEFAKAFLVEMFLYDLVDVETTTVSVIDGKEVRKVEVHRRPRHVVPPYKSRYDPNFKPARDAEPKMVIQDTLDNFGSWLERAVFWDERLCLGDGVSISKATGMTRAEVVAGVKGSAEWQKNKAWIAATTAKIRGEVDEESKELDFERERGDLQPMKPSAPTLWEREGIPEPRSWTALTKWGLIKLRRVLRAMGLPTKGKADELRTRICERLDITIPDGAVTRHNQAPTVTAPAVTIVEEKVLVLEEAAV